MALRLAVSSVCLTADAERCLPVRTGVSVKSPSVPLGLKPRARGAVKNAAVARQRVAIPPVEMQVPVVLSEVKALPPCGAGCIQVVWKIPYRAGAVGCSPPVVFEGLRPSPASHLDPTPTSAAPLHDSYGN